MSLRSEISSCLTDYIKRGTIENGEKYYHDFDSGEYFIAPTMYSDYYGSTVEKSNCIYFMDKFPFLSERYLSYNGSCVFFTINDLWEKYQENPESIHEFFSDLNALENHPVLDEDLMCEIELEVQQEMWSGVYRHDFICELQSLFNLSDDDFDALADNPDDVSSLFIDLCDSTNEYWEMEGPSSAYIDIKRVAAGATIEDINEILGRD